MLQKFQYKIFIQFAQYVYVYCLSHNIKLLNILKANMELKNKPELRVTILEIRVQIFTAIIKLGNLYLDVSISSLGTR